MQTAYEYIKQGKIDSIRISTRPDYIDKKILKRLKKYKVETIYTDELELSTKENPSGVRKFCKENGIAKMAPKSKELER